MVEAGIGYFGDARRAATGQELIKRAVAGGTLVLRKLAESRAAEVRYQRFLSAAEVTVDELLATAGASTAAAAAGRRVLAIQDTTEISFGRARQQPASLGPGTDDRSPALFAHPVLAVDRDDDAVLGPVYGDIWTRESAKVAADRARRERADKESKRWLDAMVATRARLEQAREVVMVADREADIYTPFAECPAGMEMVVRAHHDRKLADGRKMSDAAASWEVVCHADVHVAPRGPGDTGRRARVALRAGTLELVRPATSLEARAPRVRLNMVQITEPDPPKGKKALHWRLLTTLPVEGREHALEIAQIYRQRWRIEQLFRSMKRDGLGLEDSQLVRRDHLFKITAIALIAASRTMQLVDARDGSNRPASDVLDADLLPLAEAIWRRLEGRTARQQNPHPKHSLAWLAWIVARLGGWHGYYKPPGPKTMRDGWDVFADRIQGYAQALHDLQPQNP